MSVREVKLIQNIVFRIVWKLIILPMIKKLFIPFNDLIPWNKKEINRCFNNNFNRYWIIYSPHNVCIIAIIGGFNNHLGPILSYLFRYCSLKILFFQNNFFLKQRTNSCYQQTFIQWQDLIETSDFFFVLYGNANKYKLIWFEYVLSMRIKLFI